MTTPTDDPKVKELLEAAKALEMSFSEEGSRTAENNWHVTSFEYRERLNNAVAAFDPPKPKKEYTMPEWGELIKRDGVETGEKVYGGESGVAGWNGGWFTRDQYNAIRDALATAKD